MGTDCDAVRDIAGELALGIASGEERARALEHIAGCAACRRELERLSAVADELLVLAPESEPPPGFETRALNAMIGRPAPRRRRVRRFFALPAVGLAGAALATGVLLVATSNDRNLASDYRQALAAANGTQFAAVPLRDDSGAKRGSLSLYRGTPSWLVVTVPKDAQSSVARAEIVSKSGAHMSLAGFKLRDGVWGGRLPMAFDDVASVQLLSRRGRSVLVAYTKGAWKM
jgi:Putative zinc-finger